MFTNIKYTTGEIVNFVTKQFKVGTYLILNNKPSLQFNLEEPEKDFHIRIRKEAISNGNEIIDGDVIDCKEININPFKK